jgi:hypothetical protein
VFFGKWNKEIGARRRIFGVAAVDGIAGVGGMVAEILAVLAAEGTGAIDAAEPGDADALADTDRVDTDAEFFDARHDLMSRCYGITQWLKFSCGDVEVGAADATGFDFEENLARAGLGDGQVFENQRARGDGSGMVQNGGAHLVFIREASDLQT